MPTLWIHMGAPKTGSTSIQAFLRNNEAALQKYNLYIPRAGRERNSGIIHHNGKLLFHDKSTLKSLLTELRQHHSKDILLTDELLSQGKRLLSAVSLNAIQRKHPDLTIKTVTYLRRLDDTLKSWYNQILKNYLKAKPGSEKLYEYILQHDYSSFVTYVKKKRLSAFGLAKNITLSNNIIGIENTILRLFGREYLMNGNVVDDFFGILQIPIRNGDFVFGDDKNVSPPLAVIPFFMTKGMPQDMCRKSRKTLLELATDTFLINNMVTDPLIQASLHREIAKLTKIYNKYTATLHTIEAHQTYMVLYNGHDTDLNSKDLQCDKYILYLIRQLNYSYNELCILRKDIEDLKRTSILFWCKKLLLFIMRKTNKLLKTTNKNFSR